MDLEFPSVIDPFLEGHGDSSDVNFGNVGTFCWTQTFGRD